jgi:hypothetical protein
MLRPTTLSVSAPREKIPIARQGSILACFRICSMLYSTILGERLLQHLYMSIAVRIC